MPWRRPFWDTLVAFAAFLLIPQGNILLLEATMVFFVFGMSL
jgi:hypothetical protein